MQSVIKDVNRVLDQDLPTCRRCSTILISLRSLPFRAPQIQIFTDTLPLHMAVLSPRGSKPTATLPKAVTIQLELVLEELQNWRRRPFAMELPHTHLWMDASDYGWGAMMHQRTGTHGWFKTIERHIDGKDFRAAIYGIQPYLPQDTRVHLNIDNIVFLYYLRKWSGTVRCLNSLV